MLSANGDTNGIAYHQAIAADSGDGAGVKIGGVRHRAECRLASTTTISIETCCHA